MSDNKQDRRPKVTRLFFRDVVQFGGTTKLSLDVSDKDLRPVIERTPGGLLVKYEAQITVGKTERRETFVPDSNVRCMDLEVSQ